VLTPLFIAAARWARSAQAALRSLDDVRSIGPLIDIARASNAPEVSGTTIRADAVATLARLLPRIGATDGHLLDARRRTTFRTMLISSTWIASEDFVVSGLELLARIGDLGAVPAAEILLGIPDGVDSRERRADGAEDAAGSAGIGQPVKTGGYSCEVRNGLPGPQPTFTLRQRGRTAELKQPATRASS
jgi:hypothetical protein